MQRKIVMLARVLVSVWSLNDRTYSNATELAHHRLKRLLILLQQGVQLLVLVLQRLVLQHQVRCERLELRLKFLCTSAAV